jgi:hypothetical protein
VATRIDHITVTAPSLDAGAVYVERCLGVRPPPGGEHPRMGTHNLLLRLGEAMFLEVIAVNPHAPRPARPRWFALDELAPEAVPRLACWVARTDDIQASAATTSEALGRVQTMTRGDLEWLISIPDDGSLPLGGVGPALIQWHASAHPAARMQDLGCALVSLELRHPDPERVRRLLDSLALSEPSVAVSVVRAAEAGLSVHIRTPTGLRAIDC